MVFKSFAAAVLMAGLLTASCGGSGSPAPTIGNSVPTLTTLSPATIAADFRSGATNTTVIVTGTEFIGGSVVRLDGTDQLTTFSSSTQLRAIITTATMLSLQGARTITAFNPSPGGGISNGLTLTIGPPLS